jgi:hypothetical protein
MGFRRRMARKKPVLDRSLEGRINWKAGLGPSK